MNRHWIDLRSDTVTRPDEAMRRVMMEAEVGDDVFGDDPTINRLQEVVADLLGKESALYVPSGTMGNQIALKAQTAIGDQVLMEDGAHIYRYEAGAPASLCGLLVTCLDYPRGWLRWPDIESALNPDNVHCAPPTLICLENTHNRAGGIIFPQKEIVEIGRQATDRGLRVHLDGARLWHAHIASGLSMSELAAPVDTVSVCFSKALGAPVGSVLAGDAKTIARAHRFRKMFGGAMRQAGILAAACLYALEHNLPRLADDHTHALFIADGLDHPDLKVNHQVDTNIVIIDVDGPGRDQALLDHLECEGIKGIGFGPGRVRLIPNLDISGQEVKLVLAALNSFR